MIKKFRNFLADESGAVSVDWVVLTACVVAFCAALVAQVQSSSDGLASDTGDYMTNMEL